MTPRTRGFLAAYAKCGNVTEAARLSKTHRQRHYESIGDPEYAAAFAAALDEYRDRLRSEITERALKGIAEPIIYQGQICFEPRRNPKTGKIMRSRDRVLIDPKTGNTVRYPGHVLMSDTPLVVWKKSDVLLMFEAKKHMPEYREAFNVEHTGAGGGALTVDVRFVKAEG